MAKEDFKVFVQKNPKLINYVRSGSMTWQRFYEMYDLYGEDESVWNEYLNEKTVVSTPSIMDLMKTLDLDSIQNGVNSMQRILGLFQDIGNNKEKKENGRPRPRPLYKHFED